MTVTLRIVDDTGTEQLSMGPFASYTLLLNTLDLGYPAVREVSMSSSGMDGEDDVTTYTGSRAVVAEVTLPETGVGSVMDTIRGLMHPGRRYWLYVGRDDWSAERMVRVRAATLSMKSDRLPLTAQLGWKAPKPNLQSTTVSSVTLAPQYQSGGGFSGPFSGPFYGNPGLVPGSSVVTVGGTIDAYPVLDIYGPCDSPLFRVVDTGQQMSFPGLSIAAGDYLHVDVAARSITLNNDPAQPRYDRLDFVTASWPTLPPGSPEVVFSATGTGPSTAAVVSWRNQWT